MPSPQPSPTGEGVGCSGFRRCRPSEKECSKYQRQEFFRQPLSQGRWNKRCERFFGRPLNPQVGCVPQGTHAVGWDCSYLNSNSHPILSPRGRELERGQQAARLVLGRLGSLGKIAEIREMPSPQPSPMGEGADCSGFRRCRPSEKECPKYQQREFFR